MVWHVAYGIFYTPVDMNTWCNQRHNVPYVFPETSQSDPFTPEHHHLQLSDACLGTTAVSFTALQLHAPPQYIQQWSTSLEKQLGSQTTLEVGYLGAGGFHLQRSHLINNSLPGAGLIQPRRPFPKISFVNNTVFPSTVTVSSSTFPVSTINLLENTSQSWYDAGYVNIRRRYARGLSFLANYTFAKSLENAPDFRSPMFESAIPQNDNDLRAEKGPGCDVRQRFALSAVYSPQSWNRTALTRSTDTRLAWFAGIPGANGLSRNHLGVWRYGKCRNCSWRKSDSRQCDGRTGLSQWHEERNHMVQSGGFRGASCIHFRQCEQELGLRSRNGNNGRGNCSRLQCSRKDAPRSTRGVLQRAEPHKPRDAEPLREYRELWQHYGGDNPRPRDSAERKTLILTQIIAGLHCGSASGVRCLLLLQRHPARTGPFGNG